ncbi:hypothetical protein, partial [Klebsiella variicola]|uniref:hypothetical protein n=1 Tax=Klebsiella variicola TaxID=244366 RepID=UPI001C26156C
MVKNACHGNGFISWGKHKFTCPQQLPTSTLYHTVSRGAALTLRDKNGPGRAHGRYKFPLYWSRTLLMMIKGEKVMNRLSLIRYTSAAAL